MDHAAGIAVIIAQEMMHCQIADYWSQVLGKKDILAYQASKRGGYLYCELKENGRIAISGKAALVAVSEIMAEL